MDDDVRRYRQTELVGEDGDSAEQVILRLKAKLLALLVNDGALAVSDFYVDVWHDGLHNKTRVTVEILGEDYGA